MVALTGSDLTGTSARVRAKRPDGSWGPWYEADTLESNADDGQAGGPRGTDPVFVGTTTVVQIAVTRPAGAPVTVATPEQGVAAGGELGYLPATAEHSFSQNLSAVLITPPTAPVDTQWAPPTAVLAPGQPPNIIPRAQWGPTSRCGAAARCTAARFTPPWCTTPRAATTTHPRIPRRSCGRSTPTTPAPWAGATSPTTPWWTSTARSSRGGRAESPRMSWDLTPAGSTATCGASR